jgi:hypothetical protein
MFLEQMIAQSPLASDLQGDILIVPAMGARDDIDDTRIDTNYVAKLSRLYADTPKEDGGIERFSDKMERLVNTMSNQVQPDVILIDSRAGLHDLSAGSIVRIAHESFFFIVDTPQNWQGYYALLSHWQHFPESLKNIRNRINIVHALIPDRGEELCRSFQEKSYSLLMNTIYEKTDAGQEDEDMFNYAQEDSDAPHTPCNIYWDKAFVHFFYNSFDDQAMSQAIVLGYSSILERIQTIIDN